MDVEKMLERVEGFCRRHHRALNERIEANRKRFGSRVTICDFHCHTTHSDGSHDVDSTAGWAREAGLDLLAITDHNTLDQAGECELDTSLWCGQEYKSGHHHYVALGYHDGVLDGDDGPLENLKKVREAGGLLVLAHPAGWMGNIYDPAVYSDLKFLSSFSAMEIGNGAANLINYWDESDRRAVLLWDRILARGKRMIAFGNSDAHLPLELGIVFNGLLYEPRTARDLECGNHFVSNGPFIDLRIGDAGMGETLAWDGCRVEISLEAVDDFRLSGVRLYRNEVQLMSVRLNGDREYRATLGDRLPPGRWHYFRAECDAQDGGRAFSNPVWVEVEDGALRRGL